jgi:hypothetical protein
MSSNKKTNHLYLRSSALVRVMVTTERLGHTLAMRSQEEDGSPMRPQRPASRNQAIGWAAGLSAVVY